MEIVSITMENEDIIQDYIIHDMAEGILAIGFDSIIDYANPSAEQMLGKKASDIIGKSFVEAFIGDIENDDFIQAIIDAVYDKEKTHQNLVSFRTPAGVMRQLNVTTSFLNDGDNKIGIVCVMSDVSELTELRDALKAMKKIQEMNKQLEIRNELISRTFGRFLSDEIVKRLLDTPDGLNMGGKKKCLTIMMSDLRGFTALSERMSPAALIDMLNHYLGEMTEIIQRRNGTIIEFIGDGIMAIFGAPAESSRHASDCVAAAVEMQAKMKEINIWNEERGYPVLQMGIGINTGEMIVGNIGSEKRTKYGVVGNEVNIAGRIESYTVGGQILIGPKTRSMIPEELDVESEQEVMPKGMDAPIILSSITGIGEPYNISCIEETKAPQPLNTPYPVSFYRIYEKHIEAKGSSGSIVAIAEESCILNTEIAMDNFTNLQFDLGEYGKLFAKVISSSGQNYLLRFTSLPEEFCQWLQNIKN